MSLRKLTDEVIVNLWNEKRTFRGNKVKIEPIFFPLKNKKELIEDINKGEYQPTEFHLITILMDEYEDEIGKKAFWRGRITKQFVRWLEEYE